MSAFCIPAAGMYSPAARMHVFAAGMCGCPSGLQITGFEVQACEPETKTKMHYINAKKRISY